MRDHPATYRSKRLEEQHPPARFGLRIPYQRGTYCLTAVPPARTPTTKRLGCVTFSCPRTGPRPRW